MESVQQNWFYRRAGLIEDETIGPITDRDMVEFIANQKIGPNTVIASATVTGNQWCRLADITYFDKAVAQRKIEIESHREEQARALELQRQAAEQHDSLLRERAEKHRSQQDAMARQAEEDARNRAEQAEQRRLYAVKDLRKRYKVILADNAQEMNDTCNKMGYKGWQLEQAFPETFTHPNCCGGNDSRRHFCLIFSQPLSVE